ncbi:hypothetical protein EON63_20070 [archaeon]|nr:MAG: hypothetical protein EON63_20070 [archaeon]
MVINTTQSWTAFLACSKLQNHPSELYDCIRTAANQHNQLIRHAYAHQLYPRPLFIGVVTYVTADIISYSCYTLALTFAFAIHNHYTLHILDEYSILDDMDAYDVRWNKVNALLQGMSEGGFAWDVDYLLWVDADLVFLDLDYSIQSLVTKYSDAHIIVSSEHAGNLDVVYVVYVCI